MGVIYLLCLPRLATLLRNPFGQPLTMTYPEQVVNDLIPVPHQWLPCRSLCSMCLVTTHSRQLPYRLGETLVLDHKILRSVLFLHRGHTLSRTLESMAGINSLVKDANQEQPLPWPMELEARLNTYARWIDRG